MTRICRVLLINPAMTSRRRARFPLSLLALAGSLEQDRRLNARCTLIDGNIERDYLRSLRLTLSARRFDAIGITVMGGPQVQAAIDTSKAVREIAPHVPIVWGGYFPTLYTVAALNADYVDFAVKGPGEAPFAALLDALQSRDTGAAPGGGAPNGDDTASAGDTASASDTASTGDTASAGDMANDRDATLTQIPGLAWKSRNGKILSGPEYRVTDQRPPHPLPYHLLGDPRQYLTSTFLGRRTAVHQAAIGCRYRCTFCGVAGMFRGATHLPPAARLERDLRWLKEDLGADSIQYFDHNFFDREADMLPLLDVLAKAELPWWCYARADALLNLSDAAWALVRRSKLRMAYIGAESPNDAMLRTIRKGTKADQTLAVADLCRRNGVIPELSFMVAPPHDTEAETERTFDFIREVKRVNPRAEIIVYIYTPLPPGSHQPVSRGAASAAELTDAAGNPMRFPSSPEEWTQKQWVDYACHADAPWLNDRLRQRIRNFVTVLGCRFPTVQDVSAPSWSKLALRTLAAWRYRFRRYDRPWELTVARRLIRLADPRVTSI